jgi:hypothetical protein
MRGLDPRIHLLRKNVFAKWMDCRVKPGNDELFGARPASQFAVRSPDERSEIRDPRISP